MVTLESKAGMQDGDSDKFIMEAERYARMRIEREWEDHRAILEASKREGWSSAVMTVRLKQASLNVETLATGLNVGSEAVLRRRFQQAGAEEGPGEMIHRIRMEFASRQLRDGAFTIERIARMSGFDDRRHFAARFRAHFGMTPRQFRASARHAANGKPNGGDVAP